jgi:BirA family transcriptional regulator, biotin operon repressor / biotin---[acetyl-CoA-carboxylase] ligase
MQLGTIHGPNRKTVGRTILHFDAVESTQESAKELLEGEVEEGLAVWADRQAAGRGRHGRAWASPKGGLYLSVILRPKEVHAQILGLLAGMPLTKALRHFGLFAILKWPNDALFQERKIAGILSEGVYRRDQYHVILGTGVNTNIDLEQLPPDVQAHATSLKREGGLFVANEDFLEYFLDQLDDLYSRYRSTPVPLMMKEYRGACATVGRRVSVETGRGKIIGKAFDVSPGGSLRILDDQGVRHEVADGTVTHLP